MKMKVCAWLVPKWLTKTKFTLFAAFVCIQFYHAAILVPNKI
jgi:hypothetical protein